MLACPTPKPQALHQPTRHPSRPRVGSLSSRADFVGSIACPWRPGGMPRCPPSPGSKGRADRPARQQKGHTMTEAAVSFAGNLTEDPEVRYTESGIARAMFRVAVSGRREQRRRSSPSWCGATRPSMLRSPWRRAAGSWSWADSSRGPGRPRTAAPARSWRSWPRSWGRACGGRQRRPGPRRARAASHLDQRCDGTGRGRSMLAFRSVVSMQLRELGDFSLHPQGRP